MNRKELDSELNEWLDRASAEYGRAETRSGFEARVIANVSSRLIKRRWRFRRVSMATAAAAILVLSSYVFLTRFQERTENVLEEQRKPKPHLPSSAQPEQLPWIIRAEAPTKRETVKRAHPKAGTPEKMSFLSAGLSDQERHLIAFVQAISAQASAGIPEAESGPLQIPDWEIPTIQIPQAQISPFKIETVQLPTAPQSEDQL